jgi:hypothetical protein
MPEDSGSIKSTEQRRLAAIMFTDIVGFSRQMGANEARCFNCEYYKEDVAAFMQKRRPQFRRK